VPNQLGSTQRVILGMVATSLAMIAGTALAAPNPGGNRQRDVFGGYTSTQIVVKLRPEAMATPAAQRHFRTAPHDADPRAALSDEVRATAENWRATRMRPAYSGPFADPALAARYGLDRTYVVEVPAGTDTAAMAAAFAALGRDIEIAAVDGIGGVADPIPLIPNDTNFNLQYAMRNTGQTGGTPGADIDATAAWGLHTGDLGSVTIAIIDSGVNSHVEYGNNAAPFPNGRIVQGINTDNPLTPNLTTDGCTDFNLYHGTHVAGIAAASGNNSRGVAGVTWGAYIMPVRVLGTPNGCSGSIGPLANGIIWAANHGAQIGNMSLQYYNLTVEEGIILQDAINYANDLGMLLIAAAGNTNIGPSNPGVVGYPAKLLGCMGVSATDDRDLFASFSRYGNEVDVCAPGNLIYSTYVNNGYQYLSGTSMATPHVSGLAALVKSYVPALTNVDIELILDRTADDLGPAGWDNHYGFGRINAYQALLTADAWRGAILSSSPPSGAIDARKPTDPDGSHTYGWQVLDLTFTVYASLQTPADFTVTQDGGVGVAPPVTDVAAADDRHTTLTLDAVIGMRAWTTVQHALSGTLVRLGSLPADVNGNGISDGNDVTALATALSGGGPSRPIWSLDIDRSEAVTPADLLEAIDLLNGAGAYEAFLGATLP
jgi:hypothetical protein